MLDNNNHFNEHLQRSFNKYGTEYFEFFVLHITNDSDDIDELEKKYISTYKCKHACYNTLSGGEGMSGENNPFYGHKHTEEAKRIMSKKKIGKRKGVENNFYGRDASGEKNPFYGKQHSQESKQKMSRNHLGLISGDKNPMFGKSGSLCPTSKPVINLDTGEVFESAILASRSIGLNKCSVGCCVAGYKKTAGGYHWAYYEGSMSEE